MGNKKMFLFSTGAGMSDESYEVHVTKVRKAEISDLVTTGGVVASSMIPTTKGPRPANTLEVGDRIFAANGCPTRIVSVDEHLPSGDLYEVTFRDGNSVRCSGDALWMAYRWTHRKGVRVLRPLLLSTEQIMGRGVALHHIADNGKQHSWNKFHIQTCEPLRYRKRNLPVDPYVVGAFLGDGNVGAYARMLSFSCSPEDEETVKRIADLIGASGYVRNSSHNYSWSFLLSEERQLALGRRYVYADDIFGDLPEIRHTAEAKSIPAQYKYASVEQRWALVQGLMDTDGSIGEAHSDWHTRKPKANVEFATVSAQLAEDMAEVIRGLGCIAHVGVMDRRGQERTHANGRTYIRKSLEYCVSITCDNSLKPDFFRLERKKQRGRRVESVKARRDYRYQSISDIRRIDNVEPVVSIEVEDESHLFVAEGCIVMHDAFLPDEIV